MGQGMVDIIKSLHSNKPFGPGTIKNKFCFKYVVPSLAFPLLFLFQFNSIQLGFNVHIQSKLL